MKQLSLGMVGLFMAHAWVWGQSPSPGQTTTPTALIQVGAVGAPLALHAIEARVEAEKEASVSSQVAGSVVSVRVKPGDKVRAGAVLIELDAMTAIQQVQGAQAQVVAAQTQEALALQELERQRALFKQQYISQAALDRSQAQWEAARAQVNALKANTQAVQAQRGHFTVRAPFDGVISLVPANLGDMAMPGKVLVVMHDPRVMRIRGELPQSLKSAVETAQSPLRFEVSGVTASPQPAQRMALIPAVDAQTHTMDLRVWVGQEVTGLMPGMHARVWIPMASAKERQSLWIPTTAVIRRGELTAVRVVDEKGQMRLRQIRLGKSSGDQVEVLSGLKPGETIASGAHAANNSTP